MNESITVYLSRAGYDLCKIEGERLCVRDNQSWVEVECVSEEIGCVESQLRHNEILRE